MSLRLAVIVSHPIQHFAPWHREVSRCGEIEQHVLFCCDWGVEEYDDPGFGTSVKWDVPLTVGYAYEFLPIARRPKRLSFLQVDNPAVGRFLSRIDPHVLQVYGYAYRTNWRAVAWARRRGRPVLLYADSNVKAEVAPWKRLVKDRMVSHFYGRIDGALCVGDNNRAYHLRYGMPEERLFPGVLSIDRDRLLAAVPDRAAARRCVRERHGIPDDAFVAIFSGKYTPRKRAGDLVSACAGAARDGAPLWALLVGEGPERPAIEALVRARGARNVVLTGFVNQSEMPAYYAACDVLAVTSGFDPHPLAVTEAACFGLPVVASDAIGCIGPNDTVRDGGNGIVYPCGDEERLRAALERLRRDTALRGRMGEASLRISEGQDLATAARQLADATRALHRLGPRRRASGAVPAEAR